MQEKYVFLCADNPNPKHPEEWVERHEKVYTKLTLPKQDIWFLARVKHDLHKIAKIYENNIYILVIIIPQKMFIFTPLSPRPHPVRNLAQTVSQTDWGPTKRPILSFYRARNVCVFPPLAV